MTRLALLVLMSTLALPALAETAAAETPAPLHPGDEQGPGHHGHGPGHESGHGQGHESGHGQGHGAGHGKGQGHGAGHGQGHGQGLTIDLRQPLEMSPQMSARQLANMREHLQGIQAIVMALSVDDFDGVAERAHRMGHREGTRRMCQQFSGGGEGFMEMAMGFHDSADALAEAAKTRDTAGVIEALGQTLAQCNACHSSYRQEIVAAPKGP